jgi:hypothetical protein
MADPLRVYVCHSKSQTEEDLMPEVTAAVKRGFPTSAFVDSDDLDWDALIKKHSSYEVACVNVIADHDVIVAREHGGYLGRGLYSQLRYALELQKPTFVIRQGVEHSMVADEQMTPGWYLHEVKRVAIHDANNWKYYFGVAEVGAARPLPGP